jgi:hypothetical protein
VRPGGIFNLLQRAARLVGSWAAKPCANRRVWRRRLVHAGPAPKRRQFRNNCGRTCCDNFSPEPAEVWTRPYRLLLVLPAGMGRTLAGHCLCQPRSCVVEPYRRKGGKIGGRAAKRSCATPRQLFADRTRDWKAPRITRAHAPQGCDHIARHWTVVRAAGVGKAADLPQPARVATARQSCCGWRSARDRRKRTD